MTGTQRPHQPAEVVKGVTTLLVVTVLLVVVARSITGVVAAASLQGIPHLEGVFTALDGAPVLGLRIVPVIDLTVYESLAWILLSGILLRSLSASGGSATANESRTGTGSITVSRADVTATTLALLAFTAFAAVMAYTSPTPVRLTLAFLGGGLTGFAGFLWAVAPPPVDTVSVPLREGSIVEVTDERAQIPVDSREELVGMATESDRPLYLDETTETYFLLDDEFVFVADR